MYQTTYGIGMIAKAHSLEPSQQRRTSGSAPASVDSAATSLPTGRRGARTTLGLALVLLLSACATLPQVGPNKRQLLAGSTESQGAAFVIDVDDRVARDAQLEVNLGFPPEFTSVHPLASDLIFPGDTLGLTIWENVDSGLLGNAGTKQTVLQEMQVDGDGFIFVPYAGRVRAAGHTPEALRQIITRKLDEQTPDPQVEVRRLAGDGSAVSLTGAISGQGVYPIEWPTRRLSGMIAAAGGLAIKPEVALVTVIRGRTRGQVWFEGLQSKPDADIALRGGDRIMVEEDPRAYTVLGAAGTQARVPFESEQLNALEALARVGGLSGSASNPRGVFVLRDEPEKIARRVLQRNDLTGSQRMIYVLNLVEPNGLFLARDFAIRDADTVYVTEAPFAQWSKVIGALTGTLGAVGSVSTASATLSGDF